MNPMREQERRREQIAQDAALQQEVGHPMHRAGIFCIRCGGTGTAEDPWAADCPGMKYQWTSKEWDKLK